MEFNDPQAPGFKDIKIATLFYLISRHVNYLCSYTYNKGSIPPEQELGQPAKILISFSWVQFSAWRVYKANLTPLLELLMAICSFKPYSSRSQSKAISVIHKLSVEHIILGRGNLLIKGLFQIIIYNFVCKQPQMLHVIPFPSPKLNIANFTKYLILKKKSKNWSRICQILI